MTWTKEPWIVEYMGSDESDVVGASGVSIICGSTGYMSDADALRIVACVNSCSGISTDILDGGNGEYADLAMMIGTLSEQRDELLAALKKISGIQYNEFGGDWEEVEEAQDIARAAIARVEASKP